MKLEAMMGGSADRVRGNCCVRTVASTPARKMSNRSKNDPMPAMIVAWR